MSTLTVDAPPQPVVVDLPEIVDWRVTDEPVACVVKSCSNTAEWAVVYSYCKCSPKLCNGCFQKVLARIRHGRAVATHWYCKPCRGLAPISQDPIRSVTPIH